MTTYVLRDGELVEKHLAPPKLSALKPGVHCLSDIEPFRTQDGTGIGSRRDLRDYEKRMGVVQVGNDFASHTAALRQKVYGER